MSAPHTITRRALLTATSTLGVASLARVAAAHADAPRPYSGWRLVPSATDEFARFDADRWRTHLWYATSGVGAFSPANVTVARSNLVLTAQQETYHDKSYTFGAVESMFNIPGGPSYVEVRGKVLDSRANVLSAIWMQSSPLSSQNNPNPEIDIQETFDYTQLDSHLHRWIQSSSGTTHIDDDGNAYNTGIPDISSRYHLYGLSAAQTGCGFTLTAGSPGRSRHRIRRMWICPGTLCSASRATSANPTTPTSLGASSLTMYAPTNRPD